MYQGKNPTALTSQKLLLDALNELLAEKEFKDISVSELCSRSCVSRQTFYSLFGSKENILLYQLQLINATALEYVPMDSPMELTQMCERFGQYVVSSYEALTMLIENGMAEVLYTMIYRAMSSCRQSFVALDDEEHEYASRFMAAGLCSIAQKYVADHRIPDQRELSQLAYKLMSGSIYRQ